MKAVVASLVLLSPSACVGAVLLPVKALLSARPATARAVRDNAAVASWIVVAQKVEIGCPVALGPGEATGLPLLSKARNMLARVAASGNVLETVDGSDDG